MKQVQLSALKTICNTLYRYQLETSPLMEIDYNKEFSVCNPFIEVGGDCEVDPYMYYPNFIGSEFEKLGDSLPLERDADFFEIAEVVQNTILKLLEPRIKELAEKQDIKTLVKMTEQLYQSCGGKDLNVMGTFYLSELEITNSQEHILKNLCYRFMEYQKYGNGIFYEFEDSGQSIVNPFVDSTGRFEVNPIEEYGDNFINSNFINFAKEIYKVDNDVESELTYWIQVLAKREFFNYIDDKEKLTQVVKDFIKTFSLYNLSCL